MWKDLDYANGTWIEYETYLMLERMEMPFLTLWYWSKVFDKYETIVIAHRVNSGRYISIKYHEYHII